LTQSRWLEKQEKNKKKKRKKGKDTVRGEGQRENALKRNSSRSGNAKAQGEAPLHLL
jgi:hypothetical protein